MESIKEAVEYFHKGGLVMWPLLLCSIIVVTIAIERYLYYKTADSGSLFTQEFCTLISKGDVVGAEQLASASAVSAHVLIRETMVLSGDCTRALCLYGISSWACYS